MASDINALMFRCLELQEHIENPSVPEQEKTRMITSAIETALTSDIKFPEFGSGLEWFNVSRPLTLSGDLKGSIVVVDFFTYCCINCMHILPDLETLEAKHPATSGLVVVGVHSAKFENEKMSSNIMAAIKRYGIHHPVVNDSNAVLWNTLGVSCWPTLLILSPQAIPLFTIVGEGHKNLLFRYVEVALNYFEERQQLKPLGKLPIQTSQSSSVKSELLFPGKVTVSNHDHSGFRCIIVADSGHNRVLLLTVEGLIKHIIGGPEAGFCNGNFRTVRFNNPQGVVWCLPHYIFVADTGNHAIRKIDLELLRVETVAGTGVQGSDKEGGRFGTEQSLASPWDLCLTFSGGNTDCTEPDLLLIANAGTHQIWGLALKDLKWWKGSEKKRGQCFRIAGNGAEENRNNSYPHRAAFAQPSGLCVARQDSGNFLYIADSESSSVRAMSLNDGSVKGIVGGDKDPMNLFAFGDQDNWEDAKKPALFQHPLGVTWNPEKQLLYVADSYNHKIKQVDPRTKQSRTVLGNGKPGLNDGTLEEATSIQFNEPGGLCFDAGNNALYVADTNNHCIRRILFSENRVETIEIYKDEVEEEAVGKQAGIVETVEVLLSGGILKWALNVIPSEDWKFSEDAPHSWKIHPPSGWDSEAKKYPLTEGAAICEIPVPARVDAQLIRIRTDVQLFLCNKNSGVCKGESVSLELLIKYSSSATTASVIQHSTVIQLP